MPRTIADVLNDYLAPEQPDDCREASKALLVAALKSSGPVVHGTRRVSLSRDGNEVVVEEGPPEETATEEPIEAPEPMPEPSGPPRPADETPLPEQSINPNLPAQEG